MEDERLRLENHGVCGRGGRSAVGRGWWEWEFFDARPGEVDVEEEEENAEAQDRALVLC